MSYRFYPLRDFPQLGILHDRSERSTANAEFLTPQKAKSIQLAKYRKEEQELLEKLRLEIKYASDLA